MSARNVAAAIVILLAIGFGVIRYRVATEGAPDEHDGHAASEMAMPSSAAAVTAQQDPNLPPAGDAANARIANSPRHGEWVMIRVGSDSIRSWVVYPERSDKAPVVLVVHEIFGLSNWIRAVADQLAAEGFIAIAPDLLTMKNPPLAADGEVNADAARSLIRELTTDDVNRWLKGVADWGMKLPAATQKYGIVGFCWGGGTSFGYAVAAPDLSASVVYYGTSPATASLSSIRAPVLGLYGGNDARVNATVPPADSAMKAMAKTYEPHILEGAGHGFLRQQDGQDGANMAATRAAWPLTIQWFKRYLEN
jgi:carboxymethylenebutenolidase